MMHRMVVTFHSLRYLRPSMIYWRVHRTVKGMLIDLGSRFALTRRLLHRPLPHVSVSRIPRLSGHYHCEHIDLTVLRFSFLRDAETLPRDPHDLRACVQHKPLLWQFHLGYHDYLLPLMEAGAKAAEDDARGTAGGGGCDSVGTHGDTAAEEVLEFIVLWSEAFPPDALGARTSAWHPYVLSIRIEAWIRVHTLLIDAGIEEADPRLQLLATGIERMTRVLLRNLEKGTLANHLLRNIKALLFAGLYLDTVTGAQARRIGLKLLHRELAEQILDDGCHFERSPMYHVSVLNDMLDMAEAIILCEGTVPDALSTAVQRMTDFLLFMRHPDGEIPFFNDSTGSFFLRTTEVLERGVALCNELCFSEDETATPAEAGPVTGTAEESPREVKETPRSSEADMSVQAGNATDEGGAGHIEPEVVGDLLDPRRVSGLLVAATPRVWLVMDAGLVGPDYQPGHAHCDTLSFELSLDGRRFVTDTGVYHYRESPERSYSRSTAAHNTVEIDTAEQSEVWKSFRVGRRANIRHISRSEHGGYTLLRGMHDGYSRLQSGLLHERAMLLAPGMLLVADWLHGQGRHGYRSYLHFHPDVSIAPTGSEEYSAGQDNGTVCIRAEGNGRTRLITTDYYPAFGERRHRPSLVFEGEQRFPSLLITSMVFGSDVPEFRHNDSGLYVEGFGAVHSILRHQ